MTNQPCHEFPRVSVLTLDREDAPYILIQFGESETTNLLLTRASARALARALTTEAITRALALEVI